MEWDYSGKKGRDGQKNKIGKANKKRKNEKSKKEQKMRKRMDKEGKGRKVGTPASLRVGISGNRSDVLLTSYHTTNVSRHYYMQTDRIEKSVSYP